MTDGISLHLGDCLDVLRTLESGSVDAVVTDPPYGIGYRYGENRELADDPQAYAAFLLPVVQECKRIAKPGAFFAIWQTQLNYRHFWTWFGDGIHVYAAAKNWVQLRKTPINYGYDPVICWYQPGEPLRPQKPARSIDFHVGNTRPDPRKPLNLGHPCPRPIDTARELIANFTPEGGTILDPFAGSGTIPLAAHGLGRKAIGIEIDPTYFKIAERRIAEAANTLECAK